MKSSSVLRFPFADRSISSLQIAENPIPSPEELYAFRALIKQAEASDDHDEAKRAFKEKRKPGFSGR